MVSKLVAIITVFLVVAVSLLDWTRHGHFSDESKRQSVIEDILAEGIPSLDDKTLDVQVKTRTAFVRGAVDTVAERERATAAALRTPGLLTIYNDIKLDALLEDLLVKLKGMLASDDTEGEFDYRVASDGHTVTLHGWVPVGEEDLKQAIEDLVHKIPGVRRVINQIGIGPPGGVLEDIAAILRLQNIYFDYNKAVIRSESINSVKQIAALLIDKYPDVRLQIGGHTDAIASEAYNQRLSEARALSVKNALVEFGVPESRLEGIGYGELRPIAPNNTPEGRADNRRIEFSLVGSAPR